MFRDRAGEQFPFGNHRDGCETTRKDEVTASALAFDTYPGGTRGGESRAGERQGKTERQRQRERWTERGDAGAYLRLHLPCRHLETS